MSNPEDLNIPEEAIVKPEDERPVKREVLPEEVPSKDEAEYENLKQADFDSDGDDNLIGILRYKHDIIEIN